MRIVVSATEEPQVTNLDDLARLAVVVPADLPADQLTDRLQPVGWGEDDHAWLTIDRLRERGRPDDAEWVAGFAGMVAYARSMGWVHPAGAALRAHLTDV